MAATSPIRLVARVLLRLQQCNYRSRPPTDIQSAILALNEARTIAISKSRAQLTMGAPM